MHALWNVTASCNDYRLRYIKTQFSTRAKKKLLVFSRVNFITAFLKRFLIMGRNKNDPDKPKRGPGRKSKKQPEPKMAELLGKSVKVDQNFTIFC